MARNIVLLSDGTGNSAAKLFKTIGKYVAPAPGMKSPALWGNKAHLEILFGAKATIAEQELRLPLQVAQALDRDLPRLVRPPSEREKPRDAPT